MNVAEWINSRQDNMSEADIMERVDVLSYAYGKGLRWGGITRDILTLIPEQELVEELLLTEIVEVDKGQYVLKHDIKNDPLIKKYGGECK